MEMSKNSLRHNSSVDYLRDILFFVCFSLGANKSWELRRAASTEYTKTEKQTLFFPPLQSVRHAYVQLARVLHQFVKTHRRQSGSPPAPASDWKDPVASKAEGLAAAEVVPPPPRLHLIAINSAKSESLPDIHSHFRPPVTWTLTQK